MHRLASLVRFCSFQFTLISTRSGKSVCASPCLQDVFINAAFQTFVSVDTVCDMVDKAINAASFKEILIHAYKITITYINSDTSRVMKLKIILENIPSIGTGLQNHEI